MSETYDIAVLGSGFAGSLLAMIAARLGHSVVMLERGRHPRFAIGESSTPLSNLLLEEIATRYELPALKPLTRWGSWQREYPTIGCGLKRGFSFFHHDLNAGDGANIAGVNQILVAASPHDEIADTHWFRSDFDELLVRQAQQAGVIYEDEVELQSFRDTGDFIELSGVRRGCEAKYRARFVVDATGPAGCLHKLLQPGEKPIDNYPKTQALYSHFSGAKLLADGDLMQADATSPYPIDAAAVHHIFDGGWMWVLRFNNGITSAGVAMTDAAAQSFDLSRGEAAWRELVHRVPAVSEQFEQAVSVQPFTYVRKLSFRSAQVVGNRWALLPSAAGFVDPLLSTGFPLALLGVKRIADLLENSWDSDNFSGGLAAYAVATDAEFTQTASLIAALYANMNNFPVFRALSLLYFAAASYSETAKRLGKPDLAKSFLLHDEPRFGPACRRLFEKATPGVAASEAEQFIDEVMATIEPFDVAGLTRSQARHHYPVDANDLIESAWKLSSSSKEEIEEMLERSGFYAVANS